MNNIIILEDRIIGYKLLKLVFYTEPSFEFINSISSYFLEQKENVYFPYIFDSEIIRKNMKILENEFKVVEDLQLYSKEILIEYNKLFTGPGLVLAPVWKSFYFNNERLIFQEQTVEVKKYFKKYNLISGTESSEAEDHLGFMLNFMEILSEKTIVTNNERDRLAYVNDQNYFLSNHLLSWIDKFVFNINKYAQYNFYKAFGNILLEFLERDKTFIQDFRKEN